MTSRLRFAQKDGRRIAVRLEEPYWRCLDEAARALHLRTGQLIWQIAGQAGGSTALTAKLRLYCIDRLNQELQESSISRGDANITSIAAACPSASLVIDSGGRLSFLNRAALALSQPLQYPPEKDRRRMPRIAYLKPFPRIRDDIARNGGQSIDNVCFVQKGRALVFRSTFCRISEHEHSAYFIFPMRPPKTS